MNKSVFALCLITAVVSFIAGLSLALLSYFVFSLASLPDARAQLSRRTEANSFFYTTMHALFEGTYSPQDGSISQQALNTFREYESRLGDKCWAYIGDDSSGYHGGKAFFPSGDIFDLVIMRDGERLVLKYFTHEDWERLWRNSFRWYVGE